MEGEGLVWGGFHLKMSLSICWTTYWGVEKSNLAAGCCSAVVWVRDTNSHQKECKCLKIQFSLLKRLDMHDRTLERNSSAFLRFCLSSKRDRTTEKMRLKNWSLSCSLVSFHPAARFTNKIKYAGIAQWISKWKALPGSSSIFLFHLIFQKSWAPVDIIEFIWAQKNPPCYWGQLWKTILVSIFLIPFPQKHWENRLCSMFWVTMNLNSARDWSKFLSFVCIKNSTQSFNYYKKCSRVFKCIQCCLNGCACKCPVIESIYLWVWLAKWAVNSAFQIGFNDFYHKAINWLWTVPRGKQYLSLLCQNICNCWFVKLNCCRSCDGIRFL